jgi:hypothetical protein
LQNTESEVIEKVVLIWMKDVNEKSKRDVGEDLDPEYYNNESPGVCVQDEITTQQCNAANEPDEIPVEGEDHGHGFHKKQLLYHNQLQSIRTKRYF